MSRLIFKQTLTASKRRDHLEIAEGQADGQLLTYLFSSGKTSIRALCGRKNVPAYGINGDVSLRVLDDPQLCKTCKRMYLENQ